MALNIADLFEHAVDLVPDRVAVICGDRQVTYAELDARANRLAHYLEKQGVTPGAHIGVYSTNSIEAIETMLAAYKLRAIAINVNFRYVENELRYVLDNADVVVLMHERRYADRVAAVLPHVPSLKHVIAVDDESDGDYQRYGGVDYETALADAEEERGFPERSPDDLYILYTGGTTGAPRGVMWRQEDVWRVLGGGIDFVTGERLADEWQQATTGKDMPLVRMSVAPLIHGAAQWACLGALFACSTVVLAPKFEADAVWAAIERHKVNVVAIVGDAMGRPMVEAYKKGDYDASSLFVINSSAALFSPAVKAEFMAALPNVGILESIGSSETGSTGIGAVAKDKKEDGGPRVTLNADSIVIDDDNRPMEPVSGAVGRLARGGHVPLGYYKDPEKTAQMFVEVDGKRYAVPGDYMRIEDDGTVTLLGRGSMCINTGGEKVFVEEVEGALKSHPDVFDALVVAVADERLGQQVGAVVQARPGSSPTLDELSVHVRQTIAGYKAPRSLWLVPEISRMPSGKPDYRWAQEYTKDNLAAADTARG